MDSVACSSGFNELSKIVGILLYCAHEKNQYFTFIVFEKLLADNTTTSD